MERLDHNNWIRHRTKPTGSGLCMSSAQGADGRSFASKLELTLLPAQHQPHATSLTWCPCAAQQRKPGIPSHSFTRQVTGRIQTSGSVWKMSSSFESRFHSDVVQCKRVKKPCYLHIYIRVYRKCLYKWEDGPACTLGTPLLRDAAAGSAHLHPAPPLHSVKPQPVRLKIKRRLWLERGSACPPSHSCQLWPTAWMGRGKEGKLPSRTCRNTNTTWERILAHVHTAQGPGWGDGWDQARGKTSGCPETQPAPHPMGVLLWEGAVERPAAPASVWVDTTVEHPYWRGRDKTGSQEGRAEASGSAPCHCLHPQQSLAPW